MYKINERRIRPKKYPLNFWALSKISFDPAEDHRNSDFRFLKYKALRLPTQLGQLESHTVYHCYRYKESSFWQSSRWCIYSVAPLSFNDPPFSSKKLHGSGLSQLKFYTVYDIQQMKARDFDFPFIQKESYTVYGTLYMIFIKKALDFYFHNENFYLVEKKHLILPVSLVSPYIEAFTNTNCEGRGFNADLISNT